MPYRKTHFDNLTRRHFCALAGGATLSGALSGCTPKDAAPTGDLHYSSLTDVAALIKSGEISPVELTRSMFKRIEAVDPILKSYATLMYDRAMAAAMKAEQEIVSGNYRGPMHGIPIGVKDLCYTKGTRTMGGLSVLKDFIPDFDATVVSRLEAAGAIILGKLNLTEGAMAGYHRDFDIPLNPWDADYWAGASSSGSGVAVAAGLCFGALGSDTGGSIRLPAMANGIVGLKPTYGRVSRYGVLPLAETLDHVGPMTRTSADAAIMLQAIAGYDANDATSLKDTVPDMLAGLEGNISGFRVGFDPDFMNQDVDPGLVKAMEQALTVLEHLGATIIQMKMPPDTRPMDDLWFEYCAHEAAIAHKNTFPSRADEYGAYFREYLELGTAFTAEQYADATVQRQQFNSNFYAVLANVDAIVFPSGGTSSAIKRGLQYGNIEETEPSYVGFVPATLSPADFAGTPTLTVPCGLSGSGIPYSLQFMGARLSEARLCQIGHAYESATNWHDLHPPV